MTSVLGPWFASTADCEYAAVAPTSPEADATFIDSIACSAPTLRSSSGGAIKQMSRLSYSNEDFDFNGTQKAKMTTATSGRTWNDTAHEVGQWTTTAAGTVASSILSTTKHISSQLQTSPSLVQSTPRSAPRVTFAETEDVRSKAFGRGIDRDYLYGSPHHPGVQRSFVGYIGELTSRFTAPKIDNGKAKWIE